MKKIISIVLLACLIFPFVGTVSWLNYQKKIIRKQIKHKIIAGIDKSELVLFSFTKNEAERLKWKHSKEFSFNGSMYDIVEADTVGNNITYWCWWDYEETKLNKQLNTLLADFLGADTKSKETKARLASFYQSLFYSTHKPWKFLNINNNLKHNFIYVLDYLSLQFPPPTPPPNY